MPEEPETLEEDEDGPDIQPAVAKSWKSEPTVFEYTQKDVILYNLGIGAGPMKEPCELKYIYENHEDFMVKYSIIFKLLSYFG